MIPKKVNVRMYYNIPIKDIIDSSDEEYLEREGFTDDEIKNKIEEIVRDHIWELVPDNRIIVDFD